MTPGGAAVFLNTTQGLTHSEFTLNTSSINKVQSKLFTGEACASR